MDHNSGERSFQKVFPFISYEALKLEEFLKKNYYVVLYINFVNSFVQSTAMFVKC